MNQDGQQKANTRLVAKLAFVVLAMFGFGFAMVPIYDVLCDITGLNGKTGQLSTEAVSQFTVDADRTITVEFLANLNESLGWEFKPEVAKMAVHPGKVYTTHYYARNKTGRRVVGQAVPSVAPNAAASHFNKTECFCFTNQTFEAEEGRSMPVSFVIDPRLPARIRTVSLSYTFFDVTQMAKK